MSEQPAVLRSPTEAPADFFDGPDLDGPNLHLVQPAEAIVPAQLTPEQQVVQTQRDEWEEEFPGKPYRGAEWLNLGPEDVVRIERGAKGNGFDSFDRQSIVEFYNKLQAIKSQREFELSKKYQAELFKRQQIDSLPALQYPPDAKRRQKKQIDGKREQLYALLSKNPDDFAALQAEWNLYEDVMHTKELDRQHEQALADDKGLKVSEERARLRGELSELSERNGDALEYISQLPIEGDPKITELIKNYKESSQRHQTDQDLLDADYAMACKEFEAQLGQIFTAKEPNLEPKELESRIDQAASHVEDWLDSMQGAEHDPLADLATYKQKEAAYQSWEKRRRQAIEVLGPVVVMRSIESKIKGLFEKSSPAEASIEGDQALKIVLDPRNIGAKNGANVLRNGDKLSEGDINMYQAGVLGQIELARHYSQHQHNIMKAALILNALAIGGAEDIASAWSYAWEKMPEEQKSKEFKKKMYGKVSVGFFFTRRLSAKAAQKTRSQFNFAGRSAGVDKES
jgi:hypothetical protein